MNIGDLIAVLRLRDEFSPIVQKATATAREGFSQLGNTTQGVFGKFRGLVSESTSYFRGFGENLQQTIANVGKSLSSFGSTLGSVGRSASVFLTLPIVAAGGAMLKAGMDAVESENLFQVAFGDMADSARSWSQELSKSLGLNEFELRRTSSTLFTMLDSMGIGEQAAYGMATSMTELSQDMASFFNLKPEEAFQKLQAGITGEAEPLKRLGILVDEHTIKTAALKHGLISQGEEMSAQQKVLARYIAIMDQTQKAQGDLGRTMDSPTNQLRSLKAKFSELTIELSTTFLPIVSQVLTWMTSMVPHVQALVKWFGELSPTMQKVVLGGAALLAALGPILVVLGPIVTVIGALITAFSTVLPIIGAVSAAIVALGAGPFLLIAAGVTAVIAAWKNWDQITAFVRGVYEAVKTWMVDKFNAVVDGIKSKVDAVTGFFRGMYDAVVGNSYVPDMMKTISSEFDKLDGGMTEKAKKAAKKTSDAFKSLLNDVRVLESGFGLQGLKGAVTDNVVTFDNYVDKLWDVERTHQILNFGLRGTQTELRNVGEAIPIEQFDGFIKIYGPTLEQAGKKTREFSFTFQNVMENIPRFMGAMQEKASTMLSNLFGAAPGSALSSIVSGGLNMVFGPLSGIASQLLSKGMQALGEIAWNGLKKIGGFFKNLFGGPSGDELAGRDLVAKFETHLASMLTETQIIQNGNESWKNTVVALTQEYIAMGLTAADAERDAKRLWDSSRRGAEESRRVIQEIQSILAGGFRTNPVRIPVSADDVDLPSFAGGTKGQYVDFGRGTLAMLHGRERVSTINESTGGDSGGRLVPLSIEVNGRTLADILLQEIPGARDRYALSR